MARKRKSPKRKLKPKLLIYCEGEKTEPNYIRNFINTLNTDINKNKLVVIVPCEETTPKSLVDRIKRDMKKGETLPGDELWVVYDRECTTKYSEELHCSSYEKATKNGIRVAISNVCFEQWLLLHFAYSEKPYQNYKDIKKDVIKHIPAYEKGTTNIFDIVNKDGGVQSARKNAKALCESMRQSAEPHRKQPYNLNPYTNVYELLDALENFLEIS